MAEPGSASALPPVGFIGLGQMGLPIAVRLRSRGVRLVIHSRTKSKAEPLLAAGGALWARSPAAVGRVVPEGIVFVMLPDDRAVQRVLFGPRGLASELKTGALVVNLSTVAPSENQTVQRRLAASGIDLVESPVGGSVDAATQGTLLAMVGGEVVPVARARPLLESFSRRVEHLGPVGRGSAMKLINNLLTVGHLALLGEALALGDANELDPATVIDLLLDGGGRSRMLEQKADQLRSRQYAPRFRLRLASKDADLVATMMEQAHLAAPMARAIRAQYRLAIRAGRAEEDFSAVVEVPRRSRSGKGPGTSEPSA
ncbi:MAG: NAD(P)-dependent oxidoreductase [Thermoplasmata archaeon]|nr:NAD(P)-dependent oxidoreductase [Thermoplasmata archaeon]